jgi:hypothetical protein
VLALMPNMVAAPTGFAFCRLFSPGRAKNNPQKN